MSIERNLLIEAGAGTGKTTRLVKAVLQALFIRQISLEAIVALTFTNKAAGELKERVGSALSDVLEAPSIDELRRKPWWPSPEPTLPLSDLQTLAKDAVAVLDRADISTIHSFAFSLLKRFPLASGIDPNASIDDKGLRFDELFRREWPLWLGVELGDEAPREALWLDLLSKLTLSEVREAAIHLADFQVPPERLTLLDEHRQAQLAGLHAEIRALVAAHTGALKADQIARACEEVIGRCSSFAKQTSSFPSVSGGEPMGPLPVAAGDDVSDKELKANLSQSLSVTKTWPAKEISRLKLFKAIALNILAGGDRVIGLLTQLLAPFITHFRQVLLSEGCLTHSALLYLSREIVRQHPEIRQVLKHRIRLILIDEFQDTDPLQAELLLYLTEKEGHHSQSWDQVKLEAGKLFIVGDPKQSIYRFRGADIAAYERIGKLLVGQGGMKETLEVNYRSQSQIIGLVNHAFESIIQHQPEISPPYIAIRSHHARSPEHPVQNVEVWLAGSVEKQSVETAQTTEAEHISRWIEESKGKLTVYDPREGQRRPLLYRDVSLIFRTYSPMDRYIEALRRRNIPFAVESERYFFTTPEITDFINLLRAADDPEDLMSLVGFLRGPMAGLTDEEILKRKRAGTLEEAEATRWLRSLTQSLGREPLADVLQHIFADTFLMELAARSYHGDQTVANILKFKRLLESLASEGITTMGLLLDKLADFFDDDKIEGESPLADENYNAVRLLTIHKAKGLEYPVVFLPSLHSELRAHPPEAFIYDWRTQKLGMKIAEFANLDKLLLDESTRHREAAEENRILYVAMTRARERLVLSGGVNLKSPKNQTYMNRLLGAWNISLDGLQSGPMALRDTELTVRRLDRVTVKEEAIHASEDKLLDRVDLKAFAKTWEDRAMNRRKAEETILVTTPTSVGAAPRGRPQLRSNTSEFAHSDPMDSSSQSMSFDSEFDSPDSNFASTQSHFGRPRGAAPTLGTLLHRFLEHWDFTCEKCSMPASLTRLANSFFAQEGLLLRPLPDPKEGKLELGENDPMAEIVAIVDEAQRILADFIGSEAYEEIKGAEILGREVPFFYGTTPMMRGTMDILYRLPSGQIIIGDYKSGQTKQDHAVQGQVYQEAVKRAIGTEATFRIIALHEDDSVPR